MTSLSPAPDQRHAMRRAWPLLAPLRLRLVGATAVSLTATAGRLLVPVLAGLALDAVVAGDADRLRVLAAVLAVLALAQLGLERARLLLAADVGERFLMRLRERVVTALLGRPPTFFDAHPPGELVARGTGDVAALSSFVRHGLQRLLEIVLLVVVTLVVLAVTSWQLTGLALLATAPTWFALRRFHRDSTPAYARYTQTEADVAAVVTELVVARELAQTTNSQALLLGRARTVDDRMLAVNDAALRADNRLSVIGFWELAALALVVAAGGLLATAGQISVGVVATFVLALRQLFDPIGALGWLYGQAQQARANLARLLELLELPAPVRGSTTAPPGPLHLDDVTFGYLPGRPVLHGVTLTVAPGEHLALVGPTGSGKSTVARLAAGLLAPGSGHVRLGGVELSAMDPVELRRRVVALPQECHVLAGTLADNLRLVPGEHTDADLVAAITAAGLDPWLARLPDGLDTVLLGRGANLSAGERQLVALARAALADPEILILDEATADVDPATDALVTAALTRLGAGRTVIVVAHRPATAAHHARVVRIEDGRITDDRPSVTGPARARLDGAAGHTK